MTERDVLMAYLFISAENDPIAKAAIKAIEYLDKVEAGAKRLNVYPDLAGEIRNHLITVMWQTIQKEL